jgi:hypothetical protein
MLTSKYGAAVFCSDGNKEHESVGSNGREGGRRTEWPSRAITFFHERIRSRPSVFFSTEKSARSVRIPCSTLATCCDDGKVVGGQEAESKKVCQYFKTCGRMEGEGLRGE